MDKMGQTTSSTQANTSKNRDQMLKSKLEQTKNFSSGYGDIVNLIKKKKQRIQSAHPIMNKNTSFKQMRFNMKSSFTFNQKPGPRPTSSAKSSMREYLNKVIHLARKKEYPSSKEDINKLMRIRDRY